MGTRAFYSSDEFPFTRVLEEQWRTIHQEFMAVQHELSDYIEKPLYDQGWHVFGLWSLPHREPFSDQTYKCPATAALIKSLLPGHGAVGFSVLQPGTHIRPHVGWQGRFLRCHLALEVPAGDCALRVGEETRSWQLGQALVFDDRLEHEAWNRTRQRRVVLLLDFVP